MPIKCMAYRGHLDANCHIPRADIFKVNGVFLNLLQIFQNIFYSKELKEIWFYCHLNIFHRLAEKSYIWTIQNLSKL